MKHSIVTKTGDSGNTSLFGGQRVPKNNIRVKIYGDVDELNSLLGVALHYLSFSDFTKIIIQIQNDLFEIGSIHANPKANDISNNNNEEKLLMQNLVLFLEESIDNIEPDLPQLRNFILPGGSKGAGHLHLARTICRRVERNIVELLQKENTISLILIYLNRLSDLLFILARAENSKNDVDDRPWISNKRKTSL